MTRRTARGFALAEALAAFALLAAALLGVLRWQAHAHADAGHVAERHQAVQLARGEVERLRGFVDPAGFDGIGGTGHTVRLGATDFHVSAAFAPEPDAPLKTGEVTVAWLDRTGRPDQLRLPTIVDATLPLHAALLVLPAPPGPAARLQGRHAAVPPGAAPLGAGRSVWVPRAPSGGPAAPAFVVDNLTGTVVSACRGPSADGGEAGCQPFQGTWLTGFVRASWSTPPDALAPADIPPPFDLALGLADGDPPAVCDVSAPESATERFTRYTCVVPLPAHGRGWSGRLDLVPRGTAYGPGAREHRVCRYSADLDGSGAIDRNDEHPAAYTHVTGPLSQQNFLLVRGDQPCPRDSAPTHNGGSNDTLPHQP